MQKTVFPAFEHEKDAQAYVGKTLDGGGRGPEVIIDYDFDLATTFGMYVLRSEHGPLTAGQRYIVIG